MKKALLLLLLTAFKLSAQKTNITIKLTEANKQPIIGATVKLTNRTDSTKVLYSTADTAGVVRFSVLPTQYTIRASSIGFKTHEKGINVKANQTYFEFVMASDANALAGVTVVATKPLMRQEDDKTIVDPEPIANTSTSAYEIMEKIPGVFMDQDGNIYLNNSTPAAIFINGREQKMSTADIASILKSLPPNSIEKIEILRTPSAKYDASGSGGIVNVILKKGVKIGLTGSVNAGMNQGRFGNQFIGMNLNNSNGSRTSYFNLNYSRRNSYERLETTRKLSADSVLSQNAYTKYPGDGLYAGYGLGFELSKKWELNVDGRGSYNLTNSNAENQSQILRLSNNSTLTDNLNLLQNDTKGYNFSQGIATKYKIDTLGSEFTTDFSYSLIGGNIDQNFETQFTKPARQSVGGYGDIENRRNLFAVMVDLKYQFPHKLTFETGLKTSILNFKNSTDYFLNANNSTIVDVGRTNAYDYRENINAAYIQASKSISSFVLKVGTRMENTNMRGHQRIPRDTTFSINRTDFFPYVYLSRPVAKIASFQLRAFLIYRRTITRPVYEYLNPSPRFIDQYLYESGNPTLRPQFTQNIEANISFNDMPIFAVGRNYTEDIFTNVIYQDPRNPSVAYRTYDNLGQNRETYFKLIGAIPPGKKYFFVVSSQYNHNDYNGRYENSTLTFSRGSWTFFMLQQLKIDKRSTVSLNGFYRLKGQLQFYELSDFGSVNFSINRNFLDRKLLVTLNANDVFFTNNNRFTINQGSISATGRRVADTRRFGFNIRYNFGLRKKEESTNMFNIENADKQ